MIGDFDWALKSMIILIVFFVAFSIIIAVLSINAMGEACEEEGGKLSGSLDCRKGNEFYEIYPTDAWAFFDYTVNKYPKTE